MTYSNVGYATDSGVLIKIMPISPQAQQMSALQQQMQQAQAQQMLAPLIQKLMQQQQPQPNPMTQQTAPAGQGQGLGALLGGGSAMGARPPQLQQPQTLGVNQPIPMQMPPADPLGQTQGTPLPPNPTDMQQ